MPQRLQRSRAKGWRMPAGAVYVGRPTRWGNPFTVTGDWIVWAAVALGFTGDLIGRQRAAVALYRAWLTRTPPPIQRAPRGTTGAIGFGDGEEIETGDYVQGLAAGFSSLYAMPSLPERPPLDELRGKDLLCWCPLGSPCHADVLLELANG
jgi:hypothetical protein